VDVKRVLDTNVALYLLGGRLAERLPEGEYFVSVITEMELLSYPALDEKGERAIRDLLEDVNIVGLDEDIKERAISVRREERLKLPDAIIAATAMALDAELLSSDALLARVAGLTCRAPRLLV
jgi:predicted nucleic acid-binding protein